PARTKHARGQRHASHILGEDTNVVARLAKRYDARRRNALKAGFEANNAAIASGANDRADGLAAQGQIANASGDCGSRSAGGAARAMGKSMRVAGRTGLVVGELGGEGFAHSQGASSSQGAHYLLLLARKQLGRQFRACASHESI